MNKLSIIIPVFNAYPFLDKSIKALNALIKNHSGMELIFVNDGSSDGSLPVLEKFCSTLSNCKIINLEKNYGKGFALRRGMRAAKGDFVAFTDIDLPYGLDIFDLIIKIIENDEKIFLLHGSRSHSASQIKKYGWLRQLGRSFFSIFIRLIVLPGVYDTQCGIKIMRKKLADLVAEKSVIDRFAFDIELFVIANANKLKISDFPVDLKNQRESSVRLFKDTLIMILDVIRIKFRKIAGLYN